MKWAAILVFLLSSFSHADDYGGYAADDSHNHDGSHPQGQENCGGNYMFPGDVARLGSHTFMILGTDGPDHILAEHRSGTPPHNYQFVLRVRLDPDEMAFYKKILSESKTLPAFTTIYYKDKVENGKPEQLDRTFFCLQDLARIFNGQNKTDSFTSLFPIRASLLKNADWDTDFDFLKTYYPGAHFTLNREDFEIVVYRYLPSYLAQEGFRKAIKVDPAQVVPRLTHAPLYATEPSDTASRHKTFYQTEGAKAGEGECPKDYYLKKTAVAKTVHGFILLGEAGPNSVIATNYADPAPHNFQTILRLKLTDSEMATYRKAKMGTDELPFLLTTQPFCLADLKAEIKAGKLKVAGQVLKGTRLAEFNKGSVTGGVALSAKSIEVLVNRRLVSFLNPTAVAEDVLGVGPADGFVDVTQVIPGVQVEARYSSDWNFMGRVVPGYEANKCFVTKETAMALKNVQVEVAKKGLELLLFDCYRPQRAVDAFVKWTDDSNDQKMKSIFYPAEDKAKLFERGYIDRHSGHSRGGTVDLTLIGKDTRPFTGGYKEGVTDCRDTSGGTGVQLNMGTTFDCFSEAANTAHPGLSEEIRSNRLVLKAAMEKAGFRNYPKEWWHYTLVKERFPKTYFDFPVR